jgi:K+/H+ antiporter YhaU regulatory subunit KhtT
MRDLETFPSPEPDFVFSADDVAVAIGTPEGIAQVRAMLA